MTRPTQTVALPVRLWRLTRLSLHVLGGLWQVLTRFQRLPAAQRHAVQRAWSEKLLRTLNIHLRVHGQPPTALYPANTLLVANHVSWLDIFALNSVTLTRFVAKSEIRRWPLIGTLVTRAGTLYIERGNRRDAARINQHMAKAMQDGDCIGLFPEGTTSDGRSLLPFKASLFDAAARAGATVQPVTLRFVNADGSISQPPASATPPLQSIWRLARRAARWLNCTTASRSAASNAPAGGRARRACGTGDCGGFGVGGRAPLREAEAATVEA
ncbi:MAG: lysophospholipid acyltransferase family protein [Rivihabitans pingtungensis]